MPRTKPEIMAPAGSSASFMAAVAAGADAVYAGLKHFSARMEADNFSLQELARLAELGRRHGTKTYVTMNTLLKPSDLNAAGNLISRLQREVGVDALIIQDPGVINLARQAGFTGELHLSTLANVSHPAALAVAAGIGASRAVIPRELDIDEIKAMAAACPEGLELEAFVHGALCHCVSGRCWWSSYMGGKSGLRGRCVQPCRRAYTRSDPRRFERSGKPRHAGQGPKPDKGSRLFACMDLSLDVLVRTLKDVPEVAAWKIEGRKKGPHYVFYTVSAYKMLRDHGDDPQSRKTAQDFLEQSLGRPGTHARFLPQRSFSPMRPEMEMASGRLVGQVRGKSKDAFGIDLREEILPGDLLRIGFQDDHWHRIVKIRKKIPKRGRYDLKTGKTPTPPSGASVFLVDRREPELVKMLTDLDRECKTLPAPEPGEERFVPQLPVPHRRTGKPADYRLRRKIPARGATHGLNLWLDPEAPEQAPQHAVKDIWWWLPPVIWPNEENQWRECLKKYLDLGATRFVLNAPWQTGLFGSRQEIDGLALTAGPFCNTANAVALEELAALGFSAAYASPELDRDAFVELPTRSPLPLGAVIKGMWPLGVSRFRGEATKLETPLYSPRGEITWVRTIGPNQWIFPGWELDIVKEKGTLIKAGYAFFLTIDEFRPKSVPKGTRHSTFNWELSFL